MTQPSCTGPRIGLGFDLHRLEEARPCRLGGITLDHPAGHSDGDAVLHAVTDALLGAAGLDDIGTLFPDTDAANKDQDSAVFIQAAIDAIQKEGYRIGNVDIVIATEGPRIAPSRPAMRERLAELLGIPTNAVNVKGKTLEGMGALAKGAGVAVQAICLLMPKR
ncbi:MAG: 2-C-methyl-D-erythritol 2,4-cyclodiphosphate synthase [bacterium]|nr:2-C-methyl-D-erythritol 2,4-cyclodiphosphate synthase [bacterium]